MNKNELEEYLHNCMAQRLSDLKESYFRAADWQKKHLIEQIDLFEKTLDLIAKGWRVGLISPEGKIYTDIEITKEELE